MHPDIIAFAKQHDVAGAVYGLVKERVLKIKTSELEGAALDWAVAQIDPQCEGLEWMVPVEGMPAVGYGEIDGRKEPCAYLAHGCMLRRKIQMRKDDVMPYAPTTDWSQGGPLIDRYLIEFRTQTKGCKVLAWAACEPTPSEGPTHLVAACRAVVKIELGDTVDVPEELLT